MKVLEKNIQTACFHCGDNINGKALLFNQKSFCCVGCQGVYNLLSQHNLCDYYSLESSPGLSQKNPVSKVKFSYLEEEEIQKQLIQYRNEHTSRISFYMPTMHCSSCIWLLESLYKIEPGIIHSRADFLKKQVSISFNHGILSLRQLVELLSSLGYEPSLSMHDLSKKKEQYTNRRLLYQMGVAGFAFGNIMLISFPEYFGLDSFSRQSFSRLFGYLNLVLAIPVFLYASQDYFISAYKSIKRGIINIDFPLALGILVMFFRSSYEVISQTGIGFFDTLSGLVFFLLLGKWVQQRTIDTLSFERDYTSYFPVAVSVLTGDFERTVPVTQLKIGDRILIRNNEIIPADAILLKGTAQIDFSFVTGENNLISKVFGEVIYAGGRQVGGSLELEVSKSVSQSYLTQLWNSDHFSKQTESKIQSFQTIVSKYFTITLLILALGSALFWLWFDPSKSMAAFTSVLIIACPCALALSSPFALGNAMRMLGRAKFYLKSPGVIEKMAKINHLVFDKTGTLTQTSIAQINFEGAILSKNESQKIAALCQHSVHPLSKQILHFLGSSNSSRLLVDDFAEVPGKGLMGKIQGVLIFIGSASFVGVNLPSKTNGLNTHVFVKIGENFLGKFIFANTYRANLSEVLNGLSVRHKLSLLSGDNDSERLRLAALFPLDAQMLFEMSPADKMMYIHQLKENGERVCMIGDGLNDAGALKVADIGISVSEDTAHFSPSSDVIMDARSFEKLSRIFQYAKNTLSVIYASFAISLLYNLVGLSFAVQGKLSPIIAAVLMPISSISVILFTTLATYLLARKNKLFNNLI
jgi:Cu+-exporting ATPase